MNLDELEQVRALERSGVAVGTGLSAADYFMLYGTGEVVRREQEREQWNARVAQVKAAKRAAKRESGEVSG